MSSGVSFASVSELFIRNIQHTCMMLADIIYCIYWLIFQNCWSKTERLSFVLTFIMLWFSYFILCVFNWAFLNFFYHTTHVTNHFLYSRWSFSVYIINPSTIQIFLVFKNSMHGTKFINRLNYFLQLRTVYYEMTETNENCHFDLSIDIHERDPNSDGKFGTLVYFSTHGFLLKWTWFS